MSPVALSAILVALAIAHLLTRRYDGSTYACPVCGTTREDQHSGECPWGH